MHIDALAPMKIAPPIIDHLSGENKWELIDTSS